MSQLDNPAARLHRTFEKARLVPSGNRAYNAWEEIFKAHEPQRFWRQVGALAAQSAEYHRLAMKLPDPRDQERAVRFFPQIHDTVNRFGLVHTLEMPEFMAAVTETGMLAIEFASSLFEKEGFGEPILEDEQLNALLDQIRNLRVEVSLIGDLDDDLREWLDASLSDMEGALLRDVDLAGLKPLEDARDRLVGGLARPSRFLRLKKNDVWAGIVALVATLDLVMNLGANTKALLPGETAPPAISVTVENTVNEITQVVVQPSTNEEPEIVVEPEQEQASASPGGS